jgi:long-chain acyl-CoA synthetase
MNLAESLRRWAHETPTQAAIVFEGRAIDYAELDTLSDRLAHALRARGVMPGDRVALFLPNMPDFVIAYYAAQKLGAVTVSINAIFKSAEVAFLAADSGATVLLTLTELVGFVPRDAAPALRHVVLCDGPATGRTAGNAWQGTAQQGSGAHGSGAQGTAPHGTVPHGTEALADWLAAVPPRAGPFVLVERAPEDAASLLYSSGTTGFPKGVTLTQRNIASNVAAAAAASGYRADDRLALFLPLFHVYGQNYILNGAVHAGATVALFRRFVPELVLDAIQRDRITMFFGVPTIFIGLLGMDLARWDLSSIRYEMSAASTMPEAVSRRWTERFGRRIFEGYGLTECSPFAAYNDAVEHRFGSVGRAVEGFELAIHDEHGHALPRGEWGEIVIRGPGVMAGYWNRSQESAEALRGGWLHSGDIGRMDAEGYVYIVDRVKDMINVSGFKVWPAEVEQYLYRIAGVHECAVYGVPDAAKGEQVAVAVVARPGSGLDGEQVIDWCRANLAAYKVPARVDLVTELPKSATGKLLKRVLREQATATGSAA